jgi:hypothetical protein
MLEYSETLMTTKPRDRTNSLGLWTEAHQFYTASNILINSKNSDVVTPSYYLACHSIELALKAFLRGNGMSLEELKCRKIGHDLEKALAQAISSGLESYIVLTEADHLAIQTINVPYKSKELEYIVTGPKSYPLIEHLLTLNSDLLNNIKSFCIDKKYRNAIETGQSKGVDHDSI